MGGLYFKPNFRLPLCVCRNRDIIMLFKSALFGACGFGALGVAAYKFGMCLQETYLIYLLQLHTENAEVGQVYFVQPELTCLPFGKMLAVFWSE